MEIQEAISRDIVPVVFIGGLVMLGFIWTIGLLSIGFIKALKSTGKGSPRADADDTQAFQELERGFRRMEDRVESLETLIIDKSRNTEFEKKLNN